MKIISRKFRRTSEELKRDDRDILEDCREIKRLEKYKTENKKNQIYRELEGNRKDMNARTLEGWNGWRAGSALEGFSSPPALLPPASKQREERIREFM